MFCGFNNFSLFSALGSLVFYGFDNLFLFGTVGCLVFYGFNSLILFCSLGSLFGVPRFQHILLLCALGSLVFYVFNNLLLFGWESTYGGLYPLYYMTRSSWTTTSITARVALALKNYLEQECARPRHSNHKQVLSRCTLTDTKGWIHADSAWRRCQASARYRFLSMSASGTGFG